MKIYKNYENCEKIVKIFSWNSKKDVVDRLSSFLKKSDIKVWKDDEGGITGNILDDMANAVQNAALMIVCVSEPYCNSENCKRELEYGANTKTEMILVKLEPSLDLTGKGSISLLLGSKLYFWHFKLLTDYEF